MKFLLDEFFRADCEMCFVLSTIVIGIDALNVMYYDSHLSIARRLSNPLY